MNGAYETSPLQASQVKVVPVVFTESTDFPIPAELVKLLKEHRQTADPDCTLLFPNTKGRPNGHFLRYLRAAAKRLNVESGPYCEQFKLHNLRKT